MSANQPKPSTRAGAKKNPSPIRGTGKRGAKLGERYDWRPAYLAALAEHGRKGKAGKQANISKTTVFQRRITDPDFAAAERQAMACAIDTAEDEAYRRAIEGVKEVTFDLQGRKRSERIIYSDTLLLRLLERADPTWRAKSGLAITTGGQAFNTRAERKAALAKARENAAKPLS